MAFVEVELDASEQTTGKFLKVKDLFQNVGDKFVAVYVSDAPGTYGQDVTLQCSDGEQRTLTVKGDLQKVIEKSKATGGMTPGTKIAIVFKKEQEIPGKEFKKRHFSVLVDKGPKVAIKTTVPAADVEVPF
jgi:hypothetical protein